MNRSRISGLRLWFSARIFTTTSSCSLTPALSDEPLPDLRVEAVVLREDLHHHLVLQPLVTGAVHCGEGADPDHLTEPVVADLACRCRHPPASGSARAAATRARPRAICAFTVPSGRPSRSAMSW